MAGWRKLFVACEKDTLNLLEKDELDVTEANGNTYVMEATLRLANQYEDWSDRLQPMQSTEAISSTHPILDRLNVLIA